MSAQQMLQTALLSLPLWTMSTFVIPVSSSAWAARLPSAPRHELSIAALVYHWQDLTTVAPFDIVGVESFPTKAQPFEKVINARRTGDNGNSTRCISTQIAQNLTGSGEG